MRNPRRRSKRKNFDIYSIEGRIVADVVLKYERLADDFSAFVASLGVVGSAPQLPYAKAGHRPAEQLTTAPITPMTRAISSPGGMPPKSRRSGMNSEAPGPNALTS